MNAYFSYKTPIGKIFITQKGDFISSISIKKPNCEKIETDLIKETYRQLSEYFEKKRKTFDLPLLIEGTDFQKNVWNELLKIPYGELKTYKEIAENIGKPKAFRAIGNANHNNKFLIIIPCHRVINTNGSLGGYALGLDIKRKLLKLEDISSF